MHLFHEGELAVQEKAGTKEMAAMVARGRSDQASLYASFLEHSPLAIAGSINKNGQAWASPLAGKPGFISLKNTQTVSINPSNDLSFLKEQLEHDARLGILVMNPLTRGRVRLNGQADLKNNRIHLSTEEVYGNCPKYIQKTQLEYRANSLQRVTSSNKNLGTHEKTFIKKAHTFFIASAHPTGKADVSHRGGQPGFVHVDGNELRFPDYAGNQMFNTLGNIQTNPNVGLLFFTAFGGDR